MSAVLRSEAAALPKTSEWRSSVEEIQRRIEAAAPVTGDERH
jgi:hypothetical protein